LEHDERKVTKNTKEKEVGKRERSAIRPVDSASREN
jgi:hypothetical protein